MDLSVLRGPLTQEEKDRRNQEGLCRYCGKPGDIAYLFPNKQHTRRSRINHHLPFYSIRLIMLISWRATERILSNLDLNLSTFIDDFV